MGKFTGSRDGEVWWRPGWAAHYPQCCKHQAASAGEQSFSNRPSCSGDCVQRSEGKDTLFPDTWWSERPTQPQCPLAASLVLLETLFSVAFPFHVLQSWIRFKLRRILLPCPANLINAGSQRNTIHNSEEYSFLVSFTLALLLALYYGNK